MFKNIKRKIAGITAMVCMLTTVLFGNVNVSAEVLHLEESGYFSYEINNDEATITFYQLGTTDDTLTIPNQINGYTVVEISEKAFFMQPTIKEVIIPESVRNIGLQAFGYVQDEETYKKINGFTIKGYTGTAAETYAEGNGFTFIAVDEETAVTTIVQPVEAETTTTTVSTTSAISTIIVEVTALVSGTNNAVTTTAVSANQGTYENLTYAQYEDHIEIIDCDEAATEVIIPEEINGLPVTSIGHSAFEDCRELITVKMPDTITSTGTNVFQNCINLKNVELSESLTVISSYMFRQCYALESVILPESITTIDVEAFKFCNLKNIILPEQITTINARAFLNCHFEEIVIPENVEYIGSGAFWAGGPLKKVIFKSKDCEFADSTDVFINHFEHDISVGFIPFFTGEFYGYSGSTAERYAEFNDIKFIALDEPVVTTAVTTSNNTIVTLISKVEVTASVSDTNNVVTTTAVSANQGTYENLTYAQYEDHIEIIDCDEAATEVIIPEEINGLPVTSIGHNAFFNCSELVTIKMPNTITSTGNYIFENCFKLKNVELSENLTVISYCMFESCDKLENIRIPNSIKRINSSAFAYCDNITEVIIPESVEYIGNGAFLVCTGLENVYIKNKNVKLGDIVFADRVIISTLDNPQGGVEFTGTIHGYNNSTAQEYAERYGIEFSLLDEPVVTTAVTTSNNTIATLISEVEVTALVSGTNNVVTTTAVSDNQGTYENLTYAQYEDHIEIIDCDEAATEVIIPEEINGLPVTSIGHSAFYDCNELIAVKMPDTITSTGTNVFQYCYNLKNVELSENLTVISYSMFANCYKLENITIPNSVKTIDNRAFAYCSDITEVIIPESVEYIGNGAFLLCMGLENVYIENKNVKLGDGYYDDIVFTNHIIISTLDNPQGGVEFTGTIYGYENSTAQEYAERYGIEFSLLDEPVVTTAVTTSNNTIVTLISKVEVTALVSGTNNAVTTTIPETTSETISTYLIDDQRDIKYFAPNSATAYKNPDRLWEDPVELIIPKTIDGYAVTRFGTTHTLHYGLESANTLCYYGPFYKCYNLERLFIPDTIKCNIVKYEGTNPFDDCVNNGEDIEKYIYSDDIQNFFKYSYGENFGIKYNILLNGKVVEELTIPDNITEVIDGAFFKCKSLKNVYIPEHVVSLGDNAFNSDNMESITIYNPNCEFGDNSISNDDSGNYNGIIYGYTNSTAHIYAEENGYRFVALDQDNEVTSITTETTTQIQTTQTTVTTVSTTASEVTRENTSTSESLATTVSTIASTPTTESIIIPETTITDLSTTVSETTTETVTTSVTTTVTTENVAISGDVNEDKELNVRDCAYIASMLANMKGDELTKTADFNGDGVVNIRDAAAIAKKLADKNK